MIPVEVSWTASDPASTTICIVLITVGVFSLIVGWQIYTEPIPRFVPGYRGGSSWILASPYGGFLMLSTGIVGLRLLPSSLPRPLLQLFALAMVASCLIFFLGFFIWFPRFLLPRWYRRAVKAGVPRHDPMAMGAFKALPISEQRQLVSLTARAEVQPTAAPAAPPPPPHAPITDATKAKASLTALPGLSAGITAGLDKDKEQP